MTERQRAMTWEDYAAAFGFVVFFVSLLVLLP